MRWLFADPNSPKEAAQVRTKVAAIDHWWHEFQSNLPKFENYLKRTTRWDLPAFMEATLQAIDPRLMWEFGPAVRQPGHRLVITPESERWLRPIVRTILERAPKMAGWEFYPYRLAETAEQVIQGVNGRIGVDVSGALIDACVVPGRKIDLAFSFPLQPDLDEETAQQAAFIATETLFGEQVLDTWIGSIGLVGDDRPPAQPQPLALAQARVAALLGGLVDQLPAVRLLDTAPEDNWATVKLDPPEQADDYPDRSDLVVASTRDVEWFQAIHSGQPFSSSCHSKFGETFCYLKLDAAEIPSDGIVAFRSQFEDALDPALRQAAVGCTIGGGSGLRYAYIDLALADIRRAAPIIRQTLAPLHAPLRSWLLFHDDDLAAEWIGIHSQTPPPPQPLD